MQSVCQKFEEGLVCSGIHWWRFDGNSQFSAMLSLDFLASCAWLDLYGEEHTFRILTNVWNAHETNF